MEENVSGCFFSEHSVLELETSNFIYTALCGQCRAGAQINFPESRRGAGHVTPTIFGSTVGYPSDSLASC